MSDTDISLPGSDLPVVPDPVTEPLRIIIVSPDGSIVAYDNTGTILDEEYETAYSIWLSENRALDKDFDRYSVSEGLLLLIALVSLITFFGNLFLKRRYKL